MTCKHFAGIEFEPHFIGSSYVSGDMEEPFKPGGGGGEGRIWYIWENLDKSEGSYLETVMRKIWKLSSLF